MFGLLKWFALAACLVLVAVPGVRAEDGDEHLVKGKAVLVALPFAGVLIVGLWANWQGWWQAACIVALVELLAQYGMRLDEENQWLTRKRE
jgi:hypothetical protein